MINVVRNAYTNWATNAGHARAVRELQNLTDRELEDLGIGRSQIWNAVRNGAKKNLARFLSLTSFKTQSTKPAPVRAFLCGF